VNAAPFRISDLGPADDRDADAFDRARDEILDDEDQCKAIAEVVRSANADTINELCSGAYSRDGAATVGQQLAEAAEREIDKRARQRVDGWREERALARAEV